MNIPSVLIMLDRQRTWQLDVAAFERACDGFEEVGLPEFADNPLASLQELSADAKGGMKVNRKISKILRVWIWAGLTSEDDGLSLADASRKYFTVGRLPQLAIEIIPVLTESLGLPQPAVAETGNAPAAFGHSAGSA